MRVEDFVEILQTTEGKGEYISFMDKYFERE